MADASDITWTSTSAEPDAGAPIGGSSLLSCGRYEVGDVIGAGGFGQVRRGRDRLTGDEVAIKFVPALAPSAMARVRRELAALRWLKVPGVVRLRDDGIDGAAWFMVMDMVHGRPLRRVGGWDDAEPLVLELLEVLARVHLAGVLHLDLKPGNVLVHPGPRGDEVVVLDFGLARGRALPGSGIGRIEGTPRYMAPEQKAGEPSDARADLYAVGVLIDEMVSEGSLPARILALVDALCAPSPDARPSSALEVYAAIAGRSPLPHPAPPDGGRWTAPALRALFADPTGADVFTHVPSDAAVRLLAETDGEPGAVVAAIERWILGGNATWRDQLLVMDRAGLERASLGGPDLRAGELGEVLTDVAQTAHGLRRSGRLDAATALLDAAAPLARSLDPDRVAPIEEALLTERVLAALWTERAAAADLALYALDTGASIPATGPLSAMVRAGRALFGGEGTLAAELADGLPPFAHPELEIWRQGLRASAARLLGAEAEQTVLDGLSAWAEGDPERLAKLAHWRANHLYRVGRYRDAAVAHEVAMLGKATAHERLSSMLGAASAWLDALAFDEAAARAGDAAVLARELRQPAYEALAGWLVRTLAYRRGCPRAPDPGLARAAGAINPMFEGMYAFTDAGTALRAGDRVGCARAARSAARGFTSAGSDPPAALCEALAAFADPDPGGPTAEQLVARVHGCPVGDIELQVLAFARWSTADPPPAWRARGLAIARNRPAEVHDLRLDVLTTREAVGDVAPGAGVRAPG